MTGGLGGGLGFGLDLQSALVLWINFLWLEGDR